jgi:putative transposase
MRLAPQEIRTYFVTTVTAQRRRLFQVTANADLLQKMILDYRKQGRFSLHAFVIMPDHLHALLTPVPDVSLEKAMQFIKGGFSFRLKSKLDVWMRSFNESQILTREKFINGVRYIEANPVRRGLALAPEEYPYSSAALTCLDQMPEHLNREMRGRALRPTLNTAAVEEPEGAPSVSAAKPDEVLADFPRSQAHC